MTDRRTRIEHELMTAFAPSTLKIVDESHHHAGHAGSSDEGETHFFVDIASAVFVGKTRIAAHRLINEALKAEFETGLHALRIKTTAS